MTFPFPVASLAALLAAATLLCAAPAVAQTAAAPAAQEGAAPSAPAKAKKRRHARGPMASACEAVNDPWENLCKIRQNAEVACSDLPAPGKVARKPRKGQPAAPAAPNARQQCLDAYMRNV
jgi:hypothetical protein